QNLLGPQLGEALGVARTQELLAARRLDGGRQYFARAKDFGYSKNSEETLSVWDRQGVLGDIVRVIREFRPDVIITRFSPKPAPTHGHHTASAVLALEAFRLAADPAAFPEQLRELRPWQARRIVHNVGRGAAAANPGAGMAVAGLPANVPDHPGVPRPRGRHRGGSRRGRARRDLEAAPHGRRALAHPRALDGGAVPERSRRDQQGHPAAPEPAGRPRGLPGPARNHAAEPAVLAAHGGHGWDVRRGRSVAHRPGREPAYVPPRVRLRRRRAD